MINLKLAFTIISILLTAFGVGWVIDLINTVKDLKQENQELVNTQKLQSTIIKESNDNEAKNNAIISNIDKKSIAIKNEKDIKSEQDFIVKSNCIFSNFDNENEC